MMLAFASSLGYFARWQKLPSPPSEANEVINIIWVNGGYGVSIKTTDGKVYACRNLDRECWMADQDLFDLQGSLSTVRPCNYSKPEFSFVVNPPQDTTDCLQGSVSQADGGVILAYAIDKNGDVWEWSHASGIGVFQDFFNFSLQGMFLGIIIGWIVASRMSKARKQHQSLDMKLT